jgi:O-antigen/teichoic acid export membrane protein
MHSIAPARKRLPQPRSATGIPALRVARLTRSPVSWLRMSDSNADAPAAHRAVFARMARNFGWLLSGRGFAAVASLAYLAIAARALGPLAFGGFTLILAYGQAIANLAQFRSWQAVIRYGSVHAAAKRPDSLARLCGLTATLDGASALFGAVVAALGVHLAAPLLGWTVEEQHRAALFGVVLLLSTGATATGMLRLADRFDLLAYVEAIGPAVRLCGAILAWVMHGGLDLFLVVWAIAAFLQCLAGWLAAVLIADGRLAFRNGALRIALSENRRIMRFMLQTNFAASISMIGEQLGTLAVGAVAGAAAAGAFRIAAKLADGLAKPVEMIGRVLFPEFARLVAGKELGTLRKVLLRMTGFATALAIVMLLLVGFGGDVLLRLFAGRAFTFAHAYLWLLVLAAAIDLIGFALDPLLTAFGRAGRVLRIHIVGAIAYLAVLGLLLPTIGAKGAAIAAVIGALVVRGQFALSVAKLLRPAG